MKAPSSKYVLLFFYIIISIVFLTNIGIEFFVAFSFAITIVLAYFDKIEEFSNFDIRNSLGNYIIISLKG